MKKLMIIDGNSILNRAFYAITLLRAKSGEYTNAIFGFLNIMLKYKNAEQPDGICAAFDVRGKTFRHEFYSEYKATRHGMPDELASQLDNLKAILRAMNIAIYEKAGYEADDIIGTIAANCERDGKDCFILTGDRDDLQLASEHTRVKLIRTAGGKTVDEDYDAAAVFEKYGVTPAQFIEMKAIMGDKSDNIPGVAGIGEVGAAKLIKNFSTVAGVYENIDSPLINSATREKLIAGRDAAFDSLYLCTIDKNVPVDIMLEGLSADEYNAEELLAILKRLELNSFINKLELVKSGQVECERIADTGVLGGRVAYLIDGGVLYLCNGEKAYKYEGDMSDIFADGNIQKIGYDIKSDMLYLKGAQCENMFFDVSVAAYVLDPNIAPVSLEKICAVYLGLGAEDPAQQVSSLYELYEILDEKLMENGQEGLYYDVEIPLARLLYDIQTYGVGVDRDMLLALSEEFEVKANELSEKIYESAGEEFKINSTKQLAGILFEKLKLPVYKKTKTAPSTDSEVLEKLYSLHEIIPYIMEYRSTTKLKSTYIDGILSVIGEDGRLHTNYNQTLTKTGRLSSAEPNLQNIPIREEQGRALRKMFAAREGYALLSADYSQIELRVLAHMAGDGAMIAAFMGGEDIHAQTAAYIFNCNLAEVTDAMRKSAKAVNFGIVYGMGEFSLSKNIGVSVLEARRYIESYKQKYSGITRFMEDTVAFAKTNGYVETAFRRRRYIPELTADNFNIRAFGERAAMNAPIQGTAADIIKIAMVAVNRRLREGNMKSKIIMQIHDELVLEVAEDELDKASKILKYEMENAADFKAPLKVDMKYGKNLFDCK